MEIVSKKTEHETFICGVRHRNGWYWTDEFQSLDEAESAAKKWIYWYENASSNRASSVYYILAIPETWIGPPLDAHRYSGLSVKIGVAKDVRKRFQNLKTGSPAKLIIHAIEPGGSEVEKRRHAEFATDRRSGEWFCCSEALTKHIFRTWYRNNLLPPEQRMEVVWLQERIDAYLKAREILGGVPDMVNPSINDKWTGTVFMDLAYAHGFMSLRPVKKGAYPVILGPSGIEIIADSDSETD